MATNSKDIDEQIAVSLDGRSGGKRRYRNEQDTFLKNSYFMLEEDEHLNKKIERLINYSHDSIHVSKFLYDHIFNRSTDEDECSVNNISSTEKKYINSLLEKKKDLTEKIYKITQENRELEKTLLIKKLQFKDSAKERNEALNKAIEVLKSLSLADAVSPSTSTENSDSSSLVSEDLDVREIYKMKLKETAEEKYRHIQEISDVLQRLISFSGVRWSTEKHLLDIVLLTGKILNTPFYENNPRQLEKFLIECLLKLHEVKWKLV